VILSDVTPATGRIALAEADQQLLRCTDGDTVRTLALNVRKNPHV